MVTAPPLVLTLPAEFYASVEYSLSQDRESETTMTPVTPTTLDHLAGHLEHFPFAEEWFIAVRNLTQQVSPDAALLRVDWRRAVPSAFSWYLRFPQPPRDDVFVEAMKHAWPFHWEGPPPGKMAAALALPGPRGLALRARADGGMNSALYFRTSGVPAAEAALRLDPLVEACGLPGQLAGTMREDLQGTPGAEISVVGVDQGSQERVGTLKVNLEDVSIIQASRFLRRKGAPGLTIDRLQQLAASLRTRALSYLGLKYGPDGFLGWRAYFSCEPARAARVGATRFLTGRSVSGKPRMPQY